MQAVLYRRYGSADVLTCEETPQPTPRDDEVLVKIHAASVNPYDWHFMRGEPLPLRFATGLRKPKDPRLGVDVAGHVEAVGKSVTILKIGDDVFGTCRGAFAEYACGAERRLAIKPSNVTFDEAAAVPVAGITALQGLRDTARLQPGQRVLINGASGGVGTFAVQIAKAFGAHVTGVCSTRNLDMVRSIGADRVIDYTKEDFTTFDDRYDVLLDCVSNHPLSACRRVLAPNGTYAGVGGSTEQWVRALGNLVALLALSPFVSHRLKLVMVRTTRDDFSALADLMASGKIRSVIDRRYALRETADAIRYSEGGHVRGKLVIQVSS
jgi:NADPH:quinone reductase-like Zn-dependent oxidoreductase